MSDIQDPTLGTPGEGAASPAPSTEEPSRGTDPVGATSEAPPTQDVGPAPKPAAAPPSTALSRLPQLAKVAIVLAAIGLTLTLFSQYSGIIAPVFLGINLLVTAYPIHSFLVRRGVPKIVGAVATGVSVLIILVVGIAAIVWSATSMVNALTSYGDEFQAMYVAGIEFLGTLGFDQNDLLQQLKSISPSSVLGVLGGVLSNFSGGAGILLVLLTAMVFMVMDLPSMAERFAITDRLHPRFTDGLESFVVGIRRYWLVTTVFGLIVAVLDGAALLVLGVPLPLVWAVLSFITNYIPNIGFVIGLVPPALLALFEKGPITALIVVVVYSVLNFVIQTLIQPKFAGDAVGITPTVSFLSLLLWTAVFGALGALIALPFTLMVKAMLIDHDPKLRWVNALISSSPRQVAPEG